MSQVHHISTITEAHQLLGFPPPRHPLISVLPIDERMTEFDYGDRRFSFGFFQVSLKAGISGSWNYGRSTYDFQEGRMTFLRPNQVIQMESTSDYTGEAGWTLLFHPDLIRKSEVGHQIENYSFFDYTTNEALHLSHEEKIAVTELSQKIETEFQQNIDKHSQDLLITHIDLLLKYCQRYYDRQFYTRSNLNQDVIADFEQFIRRYYQSDAPLERGILSVKFCAQHLQLSPNYFGDMIKLETGRTPKDHIQDYMIELAKTQIAATTLPISEIAYNLGFEYPQGLNKLFKAKTGMSPGAYRRSA